MIPDKEVDTALAAQALCEARQRWPAISLPLDAFTRHLAERAVDDLALRAHGADLCLAVACAAGDNGALAAFEATYLTRARTYVGRMVVPAQLMDEVRQRLRIRLFSTSPPRIAEYDGTAPLGAWIRVITVRIALDVLEHELRTLPRHDASRIAAEISGASDSPELALARARHRPQFQVAFEEALSGAPARDKALLRFHYVEGLSIDAIGTIYGVHRATAARWLVQIQRRLRLAVQERLTIELGATPSEFRSLVAAVRDELQASLARVLG